MFSVICPTMWRFDPFRVFLRDLDHFDQVDEILLIDNNASDAWSPSHGHNFKKLRVLTQEQNIFVNPAWNLGVREARNEMLCIMNDDLIFDLRTFYRVGSYLTDPKVGVIGLAPGDYPDITKQPKLVDGKIDIIPWKDHHLWGFGMLMFLNKSTWEPIPDELKLYYGDNWIFDGHRLAGRTNYLITNSLMYTPYSVTSNDFRNQFEVADRDLYVTLNAKRTALALSSTHG
jgi:hypothetical protein